MNCMYIYCMVCYRAIAAPYVRSVVISQHTVTVLLDDDSERSMDYELSVLHQVCSY